MPSPRKSTAGVPLGHMFGVTCFILVMPFGIAAGLLRHFFGSVTRAKNASSGELPFRAGD